MSDDPGRPPIPSGEEARLDAIVESFLARIRRGEEPSIEATARNHPDLASRIREALPAILLMELGVSRRGADRSEPGGVHLLGDGTDRLGDFRLHREIGRGGMGVVFEADQTSLSRKVALKVLFPDQAADRRRGARFQREAREAARLQHPGIVPVYAVGEDRGHAYYAMRLVRGPGLDLVISMLRGQSVRGSSLVPGVAPASPGHPSPSIRPLRGLLHADHGSSEYFRSVAAAGIQAAEALACAHDDGVVHRDVKPSNLLIEGSTLWVADFGLAKGTDSPDLTATGEVVGTLRYMAPESLDGQYDRRSDVYGLGATLYELLTLEAALPGNSHRDLVDRISKGRIEPPRALDRRIPEPLDAIVLRALAREPEDRHPDARTLALDLRGFLEGAPMTRPRPKRLGRSRRHGRRRRAARAAGWVGGGLLALLAIVAVGPRLSTAPRDDAPAAPRKLIVDWTLADPAVVARRLRTFRCGPGAPVAAAVADMDGDGRDDIVSVSNIASAEGPGDRTGAVSVLLRDEGRSFRDPGRPASAGKHSLGVVAADFDRDDLPDVAVVNLESKDVSLFDNLGGGELAASRFLPLGAKGFGIVAADLHGDGFVDIATSRGGDVVRIFRNDGEGAFRTHDDLVVGAGPNGLVALDLDRDGRVDLAVALEIDRCIAVLLQLPDGTLGPPRRHPCPQPPLQIATEDLDRDGHADLVAACGAPDSGVRGDLVVLRSDRKGGFGSTSSVSGPLDLFSVAIADATGDGTPDLIFNDEHGGCISVVVNEGAAGFRSGLQFPTGGAPFRLLAADVDQDGKPDVLATNGQSGEVAVLFGE